MFIGRTKSLARNAAAERALKYLVKSKTMTSTRKDGDKVDESGDWKMEVDGEDNQILPWSHIASFAMYKLFSTWGEDRLFQKELVNCWFSNLIFFSQFLFTRLIQQTSF